MAQFLEDPNLQQIAARAVNFQKIECDVLWVRDGWFHHNAAWLAKAFHNFSKIHDGGGMPVTSFEVNAQLNHDIHKDNQLRGHLCPTRQR